MLNTGRENIRPLDGRDKQIETRESSLCIFINPNIIVLQYDPPRLFITKYAEQNPPIAMSM